MRPGRARGRLAQRGARVRTAQRRCRRAQDPPPGHREKRRLSGPIATKLRVVTSRVCRGAAHALHPLEKECVMRSGTLSLSMLVVVVPAVFAMGCGGKTPAKG